MLQAVKVVTFGEATNAVKNQLGGLLVACGKDKVENLRVIQKSKALKDNEYKLDDGVLHTGQNRFNSILKLVKPQEAISNGCVFEKEDRFLDLLPFEENINGALNNVRYFINRSLGRTTGMFSRVLKAIFGYLGFNISNDSFINEANNNLTSPSFIKKVARHFYLNSVNGGEKSTSIDGGFQNNDKQKGLAWLSLKIINVFNKLNPNFVTLFPLTFCFANVLTPWLAKLNGSVGTFFKILRVVNPWIDEFLSTTMGVFKGEILKVKENLKGAQKVIESNDKEENILSHECPGDIESKPSCEVDLIELSPFSKEQYALKKTVDEVSSGLERLIGKKNNISSVVINILLRSYGFKDYQDFAARTVHKPEFIMKLHECLHEAKRKVKAGEKDVSLNREVENKFTDFKEKQVARVALALITLSRGLDEKQITVYPRVFGSFYSWQYLFMPLVTLIIGNKSLIGKSLNLIADINPIINDFCFDPLATFQEEIMTIRKESESISNILPVLPKVSLRQAIDKVLATGKEVWKNIKDFAAGLAS